MKTRFVKVALIAATAMTMVAGATMVANAAEIVKPRVASACDQMNCRGHVSVYNGSSDLNIFVCVPQSWGGSFDEYRTAAENFYIEESGVQVPDRAYVSDTSKPILGNAALAAAPVQGEDLVAYVAEHRRGNCNNVDCKGTVFATDAATGLTSPFCVPTGWTASPGELQVKLEEYFKNKANGVMTKDVPAPAEPEVGAVLYTVQKGDTLSKIAKACYGDSSLWKVIYEANKATVKNPNKISVGQLLVIPTVDAIVEVAQEAVVAAATADLLNPVEKDAYKILTAKVQQAIDVHNAVVDAVEAGAITLSEQAMNYISTGADALNVIEGFKKGDYNKATALAMYAQMDAYIYTITNTLK